MTPAKPGLRAYAYQLYRNTLDRTSIIASLFAVLVGFFFGYLALVWRWEGWILYGGPPIVTLLVLILYACIVAPYRAWKETSQSLWQAFRVPDVEIKDRRLLRVDGYWLIRLEVGQLGPAKRELCCQVVNATGIAEHGPEWPWWVAWRHTTHRSTELMPNVPEMLKVGKVLGRNYAFDIVNYDGQPSSAHQYRATDDFVALELAVWDTATGTMLHRLELRISADSTSSKRPNLTLNPLSVSGSDERPST